VAEHSAHVEPDEAVDSAAGAVRAVCICGWAGEARILPELAEVEAADHEEGV
jgi:hypothetical protein